MREIIFRGKVEGINKWVFGSLIVEDCRYYISWTFRDKFMVIKKLNKEQLGNILVLKTRIRMKYMRVISFISETIIMLYIIACSGADLCALV